MSQQILTPDRWHSSEETPLFGEVCEVLFSSGKTRLAICHYRYGPPVDGYTYTWRTDIHDTGRGIADDDAIVAWRHVPPYYA